MKRTRLGSGLGSAGGLVIVVLFGVLAACGGGSDQRVDHRVRVVASFFPLAEAARQVGGDGVRVEDLTPAGAEPHDLELTTDQRDAIDDADLTVVLGGGFQPAVEEAARARDDVTLSILGGGDPQTDPHVWLDPREMQRIVDRVERALGDVDSDHAMRYARNADAYRARLAALDRVYAAGLAACDRRTIVTAHDAFGPLARRYDLEQEPIAGISPEQEPDPRRLAELADLAEHEGVTTIFTEELVSPEVARTLAREAGGLRTVVLDPLESLSAERRARGEDYVSVMERNLRALRSALGCR